MENSHLHPDLAAKIAQSKEDGGHFVKDLVDGVYRIQTKNTLYTLLKKGEETWLSGHPDLCPEPTLVYIQGSTFGGTVIKVGFIGIGMYLEFNIPGEPRPVITSRIMSFGPNED